MKNYNTKTINFQVYFYCMSMAIFYIEIDGI